MNKILRVSALTLSLVAVFAAAVFFTVQAYMRQENGAVYSQTVETAALKQGSRGGDVKKVQEKLKRWGYYSGGVDGIYGPATKKAVEYFQRKNGLTADGVVGRKTFEALGIFSDSGQQNGQGGQSGSATNSDTYLLAKCIYAEARGESYTGQVAVGAVILNRVKSSSFPNTVAGVVYQKNAFTAVSDGQINLEPDRTALNASKDALNGWDPTYGCLYYYNPAKATSSWIFSRETGVTIGKHVFAM